MYHYIFCASINHPANAKSIKLAKGVVDKLQKDWELEADIVVDMVKTILRPEDKDIPVKEEWRKLEGPDNYFRGYYELKVEPYGYRYIKCEPYTD